MVTSRRFRTSSWALVLSFPALAAACTDLHPEREPGPAGLTGSALEQPSEADEVESGAAPAAAELTRERRIPVRPLLDCVEPISATELRAYFGYDNPNARTVERKVGRRNAFSPAPADRGQPTSFEPGTHTSVFSVPFAIRTTVTWKLDETSVSADADSPPCTPSAGSGAGGAGTAGGGGVGGSGGQCATLAFEALPEIPVGALAAGDQPMAIAAADFDGDGRPDIAVASQFSSDISLLLNEGSGSFAPVTYLTAGPGPDVHAVAAADLNGDGHVDLLTAGGSGAVSVLLNRGRAEFADAISYPADVAVDGLATADLDDDGDLDVAAAENGEGGIVLLNAGDGSFAAAVHYATGTATRAIAVGDLDGDGAQDLAVADSSGGVGLLWNRGDGSFGDLTTYAAGIVPIAVQADDMDGDGAADLVVADFVDAVSVLLNRGERMFADAQRYFAGFTPYDVTVADLDGDGLPDVAAAVTGLDIGEVSVLRNAGGGMLGEPVVFNVGWAPTSVASADFDADDRPDLAIVNAGGGINDELRDGTVSVLLNRCSGSE